MSTLCVRHTALSAGLMLCALQSAAAQAYRLVPSPVRAEVAALSIDRVTDEVTRLFHADRLTQMPPGWGRAVVAVERRLQLTWRGPAPVLLVAPDDGRGFLCADAVDAHAGRCAGRLEAIRTRGANDTTVATVIVLAESSLHARDVWEHEITHALLTQYGLLEESQRHDRRFFAARSPSPR